MTPKRLCARRITLKKTLRISFLALVSAAAVAYGMVESKTSPAPLTAQMGPIPQCDPTQPTCPPQGGGKGKRSPTRKLSQ